MKYLYIVFVVFILCQTAMAQVCPGTPGQITWQQWANLPDDEFEELTALVSFPLSPTLTQKRYKLQASPNFDNFFGSRMIGFISVPTTTTVTFALTGDDKGVFYLSSDDTAENLDTVASHPNNTSQEEFDKFPEQISAPLTLVAGQDYYFEVLHVDGYGADHSTVWWKTDLVDAENWNVITFQYLKDADCIVDSCPPQGEICDDGNASTVGDVQDGNCNCYGNEVNNNSCIGERTKVKNYRYHNIPGSNLSNLYNDANYPAMPTTGSLLSQLGMFYANEENEFGQLLQGYMTVPVTGEYTFNLTADDDTVFELSTDDDPANVGLVDIEIDGWTYGSEHDKYPEQTAAPVTLEAGKYYFYQVQHKEGGGGEHYSVFWKAPFTNAEYWKRIPTIYLFDYECSIACVPQGTPCDDGDANTENDMYDANCECIGTPCPDGCNPITYTPFEKCGITNGIGNNDGSGWLSCQTSLNPNSLHDESHWMMYDLGERHYLFNSHIWNYNVEGETAKGISEVVIDYSLDGISWTNLGTFMWDFATGETNYSGFTGPDFMGAEAQYVLITTFDKAENCRGLSKVAITTIKCPVEGTVCDDEDSDTYDDAYNDNCECIGKSYLENDCVEAVLNLGDSTLINKKYSAIEIVNSISNIDPTQKVSFIGGDYVLLDVGFETDVNSTFIAAIDSCDNEAGRQALATVASQIRERQEEYKKDVTAVFQVIPARDSDLVTVKYYVDQGAEANIQILDISGTLVATLSDMVYSNKGLYMKRFRKFKLESGVYSVKYITADTVLEERFVVE